jgi:hypothetical protein
MVGCMRGVSNADFNTDFVDRSREKVRIVDDLAGVIWPVTLR